MDQEEESEKKITRELFSKDTLSDDEKIMKWRESAFQAALGKLQEGHGNAETIMQTGEAFGRGLFSQRVKDKSPEWTIKRWIEATEEDIMRPLGTEFTFTKVSQDVATTFIGRDPLQEFSKESTVASLFNYGVLRGLFLSAFPRGELLYNETLTENQSEFVFKTNASVKDRFERERIKHAFTSLKKDDGS